jgi:acyl carrier protein
MTEDSLEEIYNIVQSFLEIDNKSDDSDETEDNLTEEAQG